ncbi:MAG: PAS domain S-box protein [Anaerolineales bacterium]|nr:PAS domain S-box protein [Chloroflexota bacterium]MBL6980550.1 PAS domain S-box protein [Anaerolineales bacterium]
MNNQVFLYLLPNLVAIIASLGVFIYTWGRRDEINASEFSLYALSSFLFALFNTLELLNSSIERKILLGKLQFVMTLFGPLAFLNFSIVFTRSQLNKPKRAWTLLIGLASLFVLLLFSDNYHHLIYPKESLSPTEPFSTLNYEFTTVAWLIIYYGSGVGIWGLLLLISALIHARKPFRSQIIAIIVSVMMPLIGIGLVLTGIPLLIQIDISHFASALSSIIIAFALFRYRLFDIVPVARDILIEKMQDIVLVFDNQTRILDANPAALTFLNLSEDEIIGKTAVDVIPNWENLEQQYSKSSENSLELVIGEGAAQQDFSILLTELFDEKGKNAGQLAIARNITEKKLAEKKINDYYEKLIFLNRELEDANKELLVLDQIKDEFVANVSHELRSPMTSIRLFHEIIELQPERASEFMETLSRESDRLADLIESILALSRIDQGIFKLKKSNFDLGKLIEEYVTDRDSLAKNKDLSLSLASEAKTISVRADRKRIGQVLSILLTNAINYTSESGEVQVHLTDKSHNDEQWVGFSVKDSGLGVSLRDQKKIFSRFFRGSVGHKSGISGTGLGLAIAKEIVGLHGGKITVESQGIPGEGATFSVWLPLENGLEGV